MRFVDNPVEDCIGDGFLPDDFVPLVYRYLRSDDRGFLAMTVFDDLHECCPVLRVKGLKAKVLEDEQLLLFKLRDLFHVGTVSLGHLKLGKEHGRVVSTPASTSVIQ